MMRRLYLQIYLACIGIALLFAFGAIATRHCTHDPEAVPLRAAHLARLLAEALPPPGAPPEATLGSLREHAERMGLAATLWSDAREPLASVGPPLPSPPPGARSSAPLHRRFGRPGAAVELPDGRWLGVARAGRPDGHRRPPGRPTPIVLAFSVLAIAVGVGAYPVARGLTRRLERLRGAVEDLGAGDLSTRVAIEGRDEVADLARSFNAAASRIERLVTAQRRMLASASHELRSPLARLRMAVELAGGRAPELRDEAERDIAELDALIEDLLLAARIQSGALPAHREPVDLLALLREEAGHVGAAVGGEPTQVRADPRLLRRLLRNLLENARRHGGASGIEAHVETLPQGGARLRVMDRGPGVAATERDRVFEPFYRPPGHSESEGGVGLGLALVREIARGYGGEARCLPREGGGSVFEVEIAARGAGAEPGRNDG